MGTKNYRIGAPLCRTLRGEKRHPGARDGTSRSNAKDEGEVHNHAMSKRGRKISAFNGREGLDIVSANIFMFGIYRR